MILHTVEIVLTPFLAFALPVFFLSTILVSLIKAPSG
jgi:hypothetical protein